MSGPGPARLAVYALRQGVIVSLLAGAAAMTLLVVMQRRVIYPLGYGGRPTPAAPPGYSTVRVDTPSGRLLVWRHPGLPDRPVLLLMHGNASGIAGVAFVARPFVEAGWSVVAPEYPGYPGNPGSPTEKGLLDAARAGWRTAVEGRSPGDVLVMGNSIGSGPAIALAAETQPRGLAVVSGIAYLPQVVRMTFPFIPDMLVHDRFRNAETLARVHAPVLVVHGRNDDVVDMSQGLALARSAHVDLVQTRGGHEIMGRRDVQTMVLERFER
jgi:hypothetical protein